MAEECVFVLYDEDTLTPAHAQSSDGVRRIAQRTLGECNWQVVPEFKYLRCRSGYTAFIQQHPAAYAEKNAAGTRVLKIMGMDFTKTQQCKAGCNTVVGPILFAGPNGLPLARSSLIDVAAKLEMCTWSSQIPQRAFVDIESALRRVKWSGNSHPSTPYEPGALLEIRTAQRSPPSVPQPQPPVDDETSELYPMM